MTTIAKLLKHDFTKGSLNLFDTNGNLTYFEDSNGFWVKREFDSNGKETYSENSNGTIRDNRPKPNCGGKTVTVDGIEYELKAKKQ